MQPTDDVKPVFLFSSCFYCKFTQSHHVLSPQSLSSHPFSIAAAAWLDCIWLCGNLHGEWSLYISMHADTVSGSLWLRSKPPHTHPPVNSPADLQPLELFVWLKTASCPWLEAQDPRERQVFYAFWTFLTRPTVLVCQSVPPPSAKASQALFTWVSVCACAQIFISFRSVHFRCVWGSGQLCLKWEA